MKSELLAAEMDSGRDKNAKKANGIEEALKNVGLAANNIKRMENYIVEYDKAHEQEASVE